METVRLLASLVLACWDLCEPLLVLAFVVRCRASGIWLVRVPEIHMDRSFSVPVVVSLVTMIPRAFFLEAVGDEVFHDATFVKTNVEGICFSIFSRCCVLIRERMHGNVLYRVPV